MQDFTNRVMVGLDGPEFTVADKHRLENPAVGAVCLFARNYTNKAELIKYVRAIRASVAKPLLIAVDHEGGRVQRFRGEGFTELPAPRTLGTEYATNNDVGLQLAIERGATIGKEIAAVDIDLVFAPVLDIDYGRNAMIGSRCFADNPQAITALAIAFCNGLAQYGFKAVGKHFPGHGWAAADSHFAKPVDERTKADIFANDLLPYIELIKHDLLTGVMLSHVNYPKLANEPATYAAAVVKLLRDELNFTKMIMTDDLVMDGADVGDMDARVRAASQAGVELFLVVGGEPVLHDPALARLPAAGNGENPWKYLARSELVYN